ncbi:MAG: hypothetical protein RLO01_01810 [Thalassobaculaceae bacterium]
MAEPDIDTLEWATFPGTYDAFGGYGGFGGDMFGGVFRGDGPTETFGTVPLPVPRPDRSNGAPGGIAWTPSGTAYQPGMSPMVMAIAVTALGVLVWQVAK